MKRASTLGLAAAALALVWLALARGGPGWLAAGAIAVAAAVWTLRATAAFDGVRLRWTRLPAFLAFFVRHSLRGGIDVAGRILSPDMRLQPGLVTLELALPTEGARVLLALVVSLMPGTLAARLEGNRLTLHALDLALPVEADTRRIEGEIARLFGASGER
jgi:multicomponent Na+:H+ antiporter subunit E